jgi:hypothetical protein
MEKLYHYLRERNLPRREFTTEITEHTEKKITAECAECRESCNKKGGKSFPYKRII